MALARKQFLKVRDGDAIKFIYAMQDELSGHCVLRSVDSNRLRRFYSAKPNEFRAALLEEATAPPLHYSAASGDIFANGGVGGVEVEI
jgi:hypothetical protein